MTAKDDDSDFLGSEHLALRRSHAASMQGSLPRDLTEQFESVLEFGDFCMYLTDGRVSARVKALVGMAEELYSETAEDFRR